VTARSRLKDATDRWKKQAQKVFFVNAKEQRTSKHRYFGFCLGSMSMQLKDHTFGLTYEAFKCHDIQNYFNRPAPVGIGITTNFVIYPYL
jgi:hypothetical protein